MAMASGMSLIFIMGHPQPVRCAGKEMTWSSHPDGHGIRGMYNPDGGPSNDILLQLALARENCRDGRYIGFVPDSRVLAGMALG